MKNLPYNRVKGVDKTVNDYLGTLSIDELKEIYLSGHRYHIDQPQLLHKVKQELDRRRMMESGKERYPIAA